MPTKPPKKRGRKPVHPVPEEPDRNNPPSNTQDGKAGYRPGAQVRLAPNRVAATKCRLKKKDELLKLATHEQEIEEQHATLTECYERLRNEVLELKCQILQHANCNCILVQRYFAEEARRVVERHEQGAPSPDYTITSDLGPSDVGWDTTLPSVEGMGSNMLAGLELDESVRFPGASDVDSWMSWPAEEYDTYQQHLAGFLGDHNVTQSKKGPYYIKDLDSDGVRWEDRRGSYQDAMPTEKWSPHSMEQLGQQRQLQDCESFNTGNDSGILSTE